MRLQTLLLAATLATPLLAAAAAAAERQPNFLFIYTDDQRWDALSVVQREHGDRGRFPWLQTPHMDRLAAEGVRFRNAFVTLPLCAPSRAVFLTGRYNHLNGIANNRTPFPEQNVTHASLLRAAGYTTAYIGKWHMGPQSGKRPGFDYSASFVGQGKYFDCPIEVNGAATPSKGWVDDVTTDYALAFLRERRTKPFSLVLGYKATHGPFDPPERARERFAGAKARPVPNLGIRPPYRVGPNDPIVKTGALTNLGYFRCISAVDDNVGRLLAALDELGLAQDTVVVFSSDNGYYLGEHSLGDKRSLYEESIRIPFLARYPRQFPAGRVVDEMILNLDLAPTWLDLAGVAAPREMQGRSWRPLAADQRVSGWRDAFLAQYFMENAFPTTPTTVAVRTSSAKLILYPGYDDWTELFDLAADPYETRNLARDPAHAALRAKMQAAFDREAAAVSYRVPDYADKPGEAPVKTAKKAKKK